MSLFASSCIVADPPEYTTAVQRAPVLDLFDADPSILTTLDVKTGDILLINVPVRSEDAGEQLWAQLFVDYGTKTVAPQGPLPIRPSTYDDSSRVISLPWTVQSTLASGCHRLTLLVAHQNSISFPSGNLLPDRSSDAAFATWLVNLNGQPGVPVDLSTCPEPAESGP